MFRRNTYQIMRKVVRFLEVKSSDTSWNDGVFPPRTGCDESMETKMSKVSKVRAVELGVQQTWLIYKCNINLHKFPIYFSVRTVQWSEKKIGKFIQIDIALIVVPAW